MFGKLVKSIFGDPIQRALADYQGKVDQINTLESRLQRLDDEALNGKLRELKTRRQNGASLEEILPEVFALVREASVRTIGLRHYDVQLIGGIVLHEGRIAEMKTGEGKTLVATLPLALNALDGRGAHLVTPNDYLSKHGLQ
ncbi:MAG: preprotein translocase subunit SecA, partial [Chloroflexi bacterium]|nr:preprotein translocase subunit SecA [Chloroflexota bacterium]